MSIMTEAPVVVRNNIDSIKFTKGKYGKLSDLAGQEFWFPLVGNTEQERNDFIKWCGEDTFWQDCQTSIRKEFGELYSEHLEKNDGIVNEEELLKEMAEFTTGRIGLSAVREEIELLRSKQADITDSKDISAEDMVIQIREINAQIRPLLEKKAKMEAEQQRRADKRAATKAKNAAKNAENGNS